MDVRQALARAKLVVPLAIVLLALGGVASSAANTPAATHHQHSLRSGGVTVNGSGESVRLTLRNNTGHDRDVTLEIIDGAGQTLYSKSFTVAAGRIGAITGTPSSTSLVRGVARFDLPDTVSANLMAATLEIDSTDSNGPHAQANLERFIDTVGP